MKKQGVRLLHLLWVRDVFCTQHHMVLGRETRLNSRCALVAGAVVTLIGGVTGTVDDIDYLAWLSKDTFAH